MKEKLCTALTIAGSDPSGGAGIQADLKTFTSLGVYGQSVITSLTAQNINEVKSVQDLPQKFIGEQFDSVFEDLGPNAVKIGMLSSRSTVRTVIDKINEYSIKRIVLDPVIMSSSGTRLLNSNAEKLLKELLIPLSYIITPNVPEAEYLTGTSIDSTPALKYAAVELRKLGCRYVLIKGGHRRDTVNSDDLLYDGKEFTNFRAKRVKSLDLHGTGCTFSAAICAYMAKGEGVEDAVRASKKYISGGIKGALKLKKKERRFVHNSAGK